ncbi:MAG: hypothetical protein ACU0GG_05790 [Paracoccaceae bacterium]
MQFPALTTDIKQRRGVAPQLAKTLLHCTPGVTIAVISSMQDYKIDAPIDAHQHAPNAHMYWIPGNMMLNAISGIAPIS